MRNDLTNDPLVEQARTVIRTFERWEVARTKSLECAAQLQELVREESRLEREYQAARVALLGAPADAAPPQEPVEEPRSLTALTCGDGHETYGTPHKRTGRWSRCAVGIEGGPCGKERFPRAPAVALTVPDDVCIVNLRGPKGMEVPQYDWYCSCGATTKKARPQPEKQPYSCTICREAKK